MQDLDEPIQLVDSSLHMNQRSIDFITIGVGCNCLTIISETGLLNYLLQNGYISVNQIDVFGEFKCIYSALITLEKCDVVKRRDNDFYITEFGRELSRYIGLITIFFDGYANLVAQQTLIARGNDLNRSQLINETAVSKASVHISERLIDPIIIQEIQEVNLSGVICDLGCGYGRMLSNICQETGNPGLGFDSEAKVVEKAIQKLGKENITFEVCNISKLQGIWEDVSILVQCHVFHDFTPNQKCIDIMNSYLMSFPNMKYFFYIDTVSPSSTKNALFPGFDYIHGLLGIQTRTYEETREMFAGSRYEIIKEISLELPNTFLWVLSPKEEGGLK